jgi:hypothetical protein
VVILEMGGAVEVVALRQVVPRRAARNKIRGSSFLIAR